MYRLKDFDPARAVCFSGHRPDRLPGRGNPETPETQGLIAILREEIDKAINRGKDTFLAGFMAGWDVLAAEQIVELKKHYPQIKLVTIAPFSARFFSREKCWTPEWIRRARTVCCLHDIGISLSEHYHPGVYYERNRSLVDHSSELICYWDGKKGGTKYTVDYAQSKELSIINVYSIVSDDSKMASSTL